MDTNHRRALQLISFVTALFVVACGGGGAGGDGAGNTGSNCQSLACNTGAGGSGSGGTTTTTTSGGGGTGAGGGDVCHPTVENGNCAGQTCECLPTQTSCDEWCSAYEGAGIYICPDGANVCGNGQNRCGYDLPLGTAYEQPDPTCIQFVNGDTWSGDSGSDHVQSTLNSNEQRHIGFGNLSAGQADYYDGFTMSGLKFYWNRANTDQYESAEGEITADCKSITLNFYNGGESSPYATYTIGWVHHPS
jgi:hypothetical protein